MAAVLPFYCVKGATSLGDTGGSSPQFSAQQETRFSFLYPMPLFNIIIVCIAVIAALLMFVMFLTSPDTCSSRWNKHHHLSYGRFMSHVPGDSEVDPRRARGLSAE